MMSKDDAIVIAEAREIVELLPVESQSDKELVKAIVGSLQSGQNRHEVEIKALKIAKDRLEAKVDQGFVLVNHELEKERIHRGYLEKNVDRLHSNLDRATDYIQQVATRVIRAEANSESAKEAAKNSRWANFDPLTGMVICAIGIIALMALGSLVKIEKVKESAPQPVSQPTPEYRCGVQVACDVRPIERAK
jgi:chromosome segregation ATPase